MLSICSAYSIPSFRIRNEYQPRKLPILAPDQEWVAFHSLDGNYIVTTKKYPYSTILGLEITPEGDLSSDHPWVELPRKSRPVQDEWKTTTSQVFMRSEDYVLHDGFFRADLQYAGIAGSTIHLLYQEFSNYKSRPSAAGDYYYDLTKSNMIMFKSLKIEIMEADNEKIKYRVIDDAGLPWIQRPSDSEIHKKARSAFESN